MILCVICGGGVWFVESACQKKGMDTGTRSWVCRECVEWVEERQKSRRHGMLLGALHGVVQCENSEALEDMIVSLELR